MKTKKIFNQLILGILFLFFNGCLTDAVMRYADAQMETMLQPDNILKTTLESGTAPNWMPLHNNPKKGDYAIHQMVQGNESFKLEIKVKTEYFGKEAGNHKIVTSYIEYKMKGKAYDGYSNFQFIYYADGEGNILKSDILDRRDNKTYPWKVSKEGDAAFINDHALVKFKNPSIEITPAGNFKVTDYFVFRKKLKLAALESEGTGLHLVNTELPFMIVKTYTKVKSKLSYKELAQAIGYWDVALLVKEYVGEIEVNGDMILIERSK